MHQPDRILAKNADENQLYTTVGIGYQVRVLKKMPDSSSVQIEVEGGKQIYIWDRTELIPVVIEKKAEAAATVVEEQKLPRQLKMSSIINPMLEAGAYTAEEVADAVIKQFPEKLSERDKLIAQIKGPRLYSLKREAKKNKTKIPELKVSI